MAKIRHNNFIDTVDGVLSGAKKEGILHLYAEGDSLTGRTIGIGGRQLLHFGTTGYLGLEQDPRLKQAAIEAIGRYGTQFPLSKSYISHPLYAELEEKIEAMYGLPPIITKNSTLGHLAVIPTLVRDEDAVVMDHQVHWSVQNACQLLKIRGIPVEMVRHNSMEMLEEAIRRLRTRAAKIWYMADGVYSMYGDSAPIADLVVLSEKYPQLYLYFDDVHGMSWKGLNGTGFVMDALGGLPENTVLIGTLSKTFGASGATFFCTDPALREKIRNFGGPLTFSAQLEPASVAAAIASADIHLSPEIKELQDGLQDKVALFSNILSKGDLPLVSQNGSPVFFLGLGTPATAYNMIRRLYGEGFYLNLGIYPAVPIKNTGIRITISSHNRKEDIEALGAVLERHYPEAIQETGTTHERILKAFRLDTGSSHPAPMPEGAGLLMEEHASIRQIDPVEWNSHLGTQNMLDWEGLAFLERAFTGSKEPQDNWDFFYYTIRDHDGNIVLSCFFTLSIWKDDMLATESVSRHLEQARRNNPLHMTSRVLGMGSPFTEGGHCHIAHGHPLAHDAMRLLIDTAEARYETLEADMLVLRDFDPANRWDTMIRSKGYFSTDMPESCVLEGLDWKGDGMFVQRLSPRSRRHFRKEILPYEDHYTVTVRERLGKVELERAHQLYCNVKERNLAVNTFECGIQVFEAMNDSPNWEFILLSLRQGEDPPITGIMFCYRNANNAYVPELIGMDYQAAEGFNLYRQLLWQSISRAGSLGYERIDLGITASFEKKKLGATTNPKIAYIQARDNYAMELLHTLQNENHSSQG